MEQKITEQKNLKNGSVLSFSESCFPENMSINVICKIKI